MLLDALAAHMTPPLTSVNSRCPSTGADYAYVLMECSDNPAVSNSRLHLQAVTHFAVAGMYGGLALASGVVRLVDLQKVRKSLSQLSCTYFLPDCCCSVVLRWAIPQSPQSDSLLHHSGDEAIGVWRHARHQRACSSWSQCPHGTLR